MHGEPILNGEHQQRPFWLGVSRGALGRCPHCGEAKLFLSYLKIVPNCPGCGHFLAQYKADDGPAYFTILIVGHLLIAPMLFSPLVRTWSSGTVLSIMLPGLIAATFLLLPRVKGAFVGVQWAVGDSGDT